MNDAHSNSKSGDDTTAGITILVTDDTADTCRILKRRLESRGFTVYTASNVADAVARIQSTPVDLVITDLRMPQVDGMDLVRYVHENHKNMETIMITGYPTIQSAVDAVSAGARQYLAKPFTDEELFGAVQRALEKLYLHRMKESVLSTGVKEMHGLIGESESMQRLYQLIAKAACSKETVLITGESGTGKELVGRAIHYANSYSNGAFVPVNCGGIPENLLESELFGYVKGAFTGAVESRAGFFQTAEGGTIFLDEIGEMSLHMQVKLLRVLQDKEVYMIGSSKGRKIDVRVIAATNKDLAALVQRKLFREDLFFRLNVITIEISPLRERKNDIVILANHFIKKYAHEIGRDELDFSEKAMEALQRYHWPGNVRELQNLIKRLMVMADASSIDVTDLPSLMRFTINTGHDVSKSLEEMEVLYILDVLMSVKGNKSKAAEILGISRVTLREKLKKFGVTGEEKNE
ncbi:MAG: sigma-54-dependent Fis family transcriptional regulator [Chitinivibrionales bacterium]|nr:sigma-54-dependent Fis family transcriptional regulator [Chitinivibrionales bacterium]